VGLIDHNITANTKIKNGTREVRETIVCIVAQNLKGSFQELQFGSPSVQEDDISEECD
jgi:hypothetical protein